jgi:transcriptional regulator NrdR family protein
MSKSKKGVKLMVCPHCGSEEHSVTRTEKNFRENETRRTITCKKCGVGWPTFEKPNEIYFNILNGTNPPN